MKTKSLILIFIALACGLVASIGISQVLDAGKGNGPQVEMVPILVAMQDIDIGGKLDANNVKLEEWPKSKIPEAALTSLDSLDDKYARGRLFKGEALLESKLMGPNQKDIAPKIPKGFAVPLKLEQETVIGLIQPGDKVDVMVIMRASEVSKFVGTLTILKDVRVFSVGSDVERTVDKDGKQIDAKTVSLLVKQEQAEMLTMSAEFGKIRLTLRRPDEVDDETGDNRTSLDQLLRQAGSGASEEQQPADPNAGGILTTITQAQTTEPPPAVASLPAVIMGGKFHMELMTPSGVQRFEWQNREALPVEIHPQGISAGGNSPAEFPVPALPLPANGSAEEPAESAATRDR